MPTSIPRYPAVPYFVSEEKTNEVAMHFVKIVELPVGRHDMGRQTLLRSELLKTKFRIVWLCYNLRLLTYFVLPRQPSRLVSLLPL